MQYTGGCHLHQEESTWTDRKNIIRIWSWIEMIRKEHIFQLLVKQQTISEEWGSLDSSSKVQSTSEIDDFNMKVLVGLQNLAFFNGQLFVNCVFFRIQIMHRISSKSLSQS